MKMADVDLKSMPFKKRMEYIWEYYKIQIIGSLLGIFVLGTFIYGQATKVESIFNVTFITGGLHEESLENISSELTDLLVEPGNKKKKVTADFMPLSNSLKGDTGSNVQMMQKFTVRIATGEIDALIIDKADVNDMVEQGMLLKLTDIQGLNLPEDSKVKDKEGNVYGLSLENSSKMKELPFDTTNKVISICASSKKLESIPKVMEWILN